MSVLFKGCFLLVSLSSWGQGEQKEVDGLGFLLPSSDLLIHVTPLKHLTAITWYCLRLLLCDVFSVLLKQIFASIWESLCVVAVEVNLLTWPLRKELVWENCFHYYLDQIAFHFVLEYGLFCKDVFCMLGWSHNSFLMTKKSRPVMEKSRLPFEGILASCCWFAVLWLEVLLVSLYELENWDKAIKILNKHLQNRAEKNSFSCLCLCTDPSWWWGEHIPHPVNAMMLCSRAV